MGDILDDFLPEIIESEIENSHVFSDDGETVVPEDDYSEAPDSFTHLVVLRFEYKMSTIPSEHVFFSNQMKEQIDYLFECFNFSDRTVCSDFFVNLGRFKDLVNSERFINNKELEEGAVRIVPEEIDSQMNHESIYYDPLKCDFSYIFVKLKFEKNIMRFVRLLYNVSNLFNIFERKIVKMNVYFNDGGKWKICNKTGYNLLNAKAVYEAKSYIKDLENKIIFFYKDVIFPEQEYDDNIEFNRTLIKKFKDMLLYHHPRITCAEMWKRRDYINKIESDGIRWKENRIKKMAENEDGNLKLGYNFQ